ncbi:peptidoglycan D,D-transpeptidase FtsI family protein [Arhodomonas sp. AD133]|uniref:peptidoglycan D,D-transpeptidase FtsI family protein n=1 Tax=Arhodomonas sp. AD133 TaxID=3415009 RepID=UPI003EBBBAE5
MNSQRPDNAETSAPRWRRLFVLGAFAVLAFTLAARAVEIQLVERDFLEGQGQARHLRVNAIPAHRGMITDRFGEPLAISSPVDSVWADPGELLGAAGRVPELTELLGLDAERVRAMLESRRDKEFVYIKRHVTPATGDRVMALRLPGVSLKREYRRFYPTGEVAGHVLGFTDIDDRGQEGLERAYNGWLSGNPGAKRVVRDRLGRVIEDVELLREPEPGRDLTLSLDRRLQYIAYRELKAAVARHDAVNGAAVVLDARNGEVLAMANQPGFNPNDRSQLDSRRYRNRAVADVIEPGSTIKPFTIAAALESGRFEPTTPVNAGPGWMMVGGNTVQDVHNYGDIDVATVLQKSSNVGITRIALSLERGDVWRMVDAAGFGQSTGSGFQGEEAGMLAVTPPRSRFQRATLAFGYGLAATPLQVAHAYTALGNGGVLPPVTFLRGGDKGEGRRIMSTKTAGDVLRMMERVVSDEGTAERAAIAGYRVAGKTGTSKKAVAGGYADDRYVALFAGIVPASDPRFVCVVMINEPRRDDYYGGQVAAPVFREVMSQALRLYNVPPDGQTSPAAPLMMADRGRP